LLQTKLEIGADLSAERTVSSRQSVPVVCTLILEMCPVFWAHYQHQLTTGWTCPAHFTKHAIKIYQQQQKLQLLLTLS